MWVVGAPGAVAADFLRIIRTSGRKGRYPCKYIGLLTSRAQNSSWTSSWTSWTSTGGLGHTLDHTCGRGPGRESRFSRGPPGRGPRALRSLPQFFWLGRLPLAQSHDLESTGLGARGLRKTHCAPTLSHTGLHCILRCECNGALTIGRVQGRLCVLRALPDTHSGDDRYGGTGDRRRNPQRLGYLGQGLPGLRPLDGRCVALRRA